MGYKKGSLSKGCPCIKDVFKEFDMAFGKLEEKSSIAPTQLSILLKK